MASNNQNNNQGNSNNNSNNNNSNNSNNNNSNNNNGRNSNSENSSNEDNNNNSNENDPVDNQSSTMSTVYTESCAPIALPCNVGDSFIDPCTCRGWLECKTGGNEFLRRGCAKGTAWNHKTAFCVLESEVFNDDAGGSSPMCVEDRPWQRCTSEPNKYPQSTLRQRCLGGATVDPSTTPSVNPTLTPASAKEKASSGDSNDTAAILGGVFGGLVVFVILVIVFIFVWRRKRPLHKFKTSSVPAMPPPRRSPYQEKEMEETDEVYDVIDEKAMNSYQTTKQREYDNPAFSPSDEDSYHYANSNEYNNTTGDEDQASVEKRTAFHKSGDIATTSDGYHLSSDWENSLTISSEHGDLSRSISVGGQELLVQDSHGYHIGYPTGAIPRQPSPIPPSFDEIDLGTSTNAFDYGYQLGRAPSPFEQEGKTPL